jgi:hypothetical protein
MGITKQNDGKDDEYLYPHNEAEGNPTRHTSTSYPFTPTHLESNREANCIKLHLLRMQCSIDMTNFQMLFTLGNQNTVYSGLRELKKIFGERGLGPPGGCFPSTRTWEKEGTSNASLQLLLPQRGWLDRTWPDDLQILISNYLKEKYDVGLQECCFETINGHCGSAGCASLG